MSCQQSGFEGDDAPQTLVELANEYVYRYPQMEAPALLELAQRAALIGAREHHDRLVTDAPTNGRHTSPRAWLASRRP